MALSLWKGEIDTTTSMRSIMDQVLVEYGIPEVAFRRPTVRGKIGLARQDFMWRCRQPKREGKAVHSFPKIARFMGLKDHTSVVYGAQRHAERRAEQREAA